MSTESLFLRLFLPKRLMMPSKVDHLCRKWLAGGLSLTTVVSAPCSNCPSGGVELMAQIVREQGGCRGNIITIADKTGVWYVNLSGHQYVAIKFPDDKLCCLSLILSSWAVLILTIQKMSLPQRCSGCSQAG